MENKIVLSLFDYSGYMVLPWAKEGYRCICVDIDQQAPEDIQKAEHKNIEYVEADINRWIPPKEEYRIVFAFPPCTNLASSGARWFKDKGLEGLSKGIRNVETAKKICEWADAPYMIENPVGTLSTYWREPDYKFHPYMFDAWTNKDEKYSKSTCLWTGGGFVVPSNLEREVEQYDSRIHDLGSGNARKRSITPLGFSKAVFKSNEKKPLEKFGDIN